MSRQKLLKIQTCKKCRAATRVVTIRSQFYLLVTNVDAGLQTKMCSIEHALEITPTDCSLVRELKDNMQRSLDHRMPVTDLQVTAAMLDPSQRNLSAVQTFLAARSLTAVDLLTEFLGRYVSDAEELQQGTSAAVITGRQEDPGEAPWEKAKIELLTKHGSSQNDPSREIQQYR